MTTRFTDAFIADGKILDLAAPYIVSGGSGALIGSVFGVAVRDLASAEAGGFQTEGLFALTKLSTETCSAGDKLFWDDTNKRVTNDGSKGPLIGYATAAATNPSSTYSLKLKEGPAAMTSTPTSTVAATGTTAADGAALPSSGFVLVTAANATKGVTLPAAAAGIRLEIKNSAAAVLKVWPATGDAVNAGSVDAVFSCPASTSFTIVAYDATTWYTIPLLPS